MNFTWTPQMGNIANDPALEDQTRSAVVAAASFLDNLAPGSEEPIWNLMSLQASARNDVARTMETAMLAGVTVTGLERGKILATAVRMARLVRHHGGGPTGWAALGARLAELAARQA